tara:strand:- start:40 stop:252 length:213 start_codon:yes stop_codon:yes gene_type:complete
LNDPARRKCVEITLGEWDLFRGFGEESVSRVKVQGAKDDETRQSGEYELVFHGESAVRNSWKNSPEPLVI